MHRRLLSRHLPPPPPKTKLSVGVKIVLAGLLLVLAFWIAQKPEVALPFLVILSAFLFFSIKNDQRKIAQLRSERTDTICDFRRAFDIRQVDPWIIRATYETFTSRLDSEKAGFPLRASDAIEHDLLLDWVDVDEMAYEIAFRAGFSMDHSSANPFYGKVHTVADLVLFFAQQPKTTALLA